MPVEAASATVQVEAAPASLIVQVEAAPAIETESVSDSPIETDKVDKDQNLQDFKCELCDFVSNHERGLNIHMSRKHTMIEQLDGVADEVQQEAEIESEEESDNWDPSTDPNYEQRTFLTRPYFENGKIDFRNGTIVGRYVETEWVPKGHLPRVPKDVLPLKPFFHYRRFAHLAQ